MFESSPLQSQDFRSRPASTSVAAWMDAKLELNRANFQCLRPPQRSFKRKMHVLVATKSTKSFISSLSTENSRSEQDP